MKQYFLFFFLFSFLTPALAQNFMFGIENGVNYSNIHQSQGTDQIDGLPGPVNGIFVKLEPLKWMVLQSGINHTTSYFNQKKLLLLLRLLYAGIRFIYNSRFIFIYVCATFL